MSKKKRKKQGEGSPETTGGDVPSTFTVEGGEGLSSTGKKVILCGIVVVVIGFVVLTKADPMGRNWAASLSPFLILGGYALVGGGIFLPEKTIKDGPPSTSNPS